MSVPQIAVVVVNWNGAHLLRTCLGALRAQTFTDFETVLVDNGSSDDSLALVRAEFPEVRILALTENLGLAGGTNAALPHTDAPIIATLNNDTEADPRWLAELHAALEAHPEAGSAASKLLLFDRRDTIHSAGDFYGLDGMPGNRGVWQHDDGQYDRPELIFGACAGAAAYRRAMLDDVGSFEDSFFMYCEDVDLSFRSQLLGYRCVYVPTAIVYHMLSATGGGPLASYYCGRNFLRVIARNMPGPLLRRVWPKIARAQLTMALESLRHIREPAARAKLRGQLAGLLELPRLQAERRTIQQRRRAPIGYLRSIMVTP
ncbi:MAG: glycosyltransferase family 2 protein [Chloroflexi bacterium]|nr:glycosyltransferase family 2 protein [Chloroflexota bacterium]